MHAYIQQALFLVSAQGMLLTGKEVDLDFYMCATKHQVFGCFDWCRFIVLFKCSAIYNIKPAALRNIGLTTILTTLLQSQWHKKSPPVLQKFLDFLYFFDKIMWMFAKILCLSK